MTKSISDEKLIGSKVTIRLIEWEPWPPEKCELGTYSGVLTKKLVKTKATEKAVFPYSSPTFMCGFLLVLDNPVLIHDKKIQVLIISKIVEELNLKLNIHPFEDLSFKNVAVQVYATEDVSLKDNVEKINKMLISPKEEGFDETFNLWMRGDISIHK